MNYLKSITTSVLNSTGVSFPFSIGEWIPGIEPGSSIWDVREGVKKDDGTLLTLFIFDSTLPPLQPGNRDRRTLMQLARNALKKLRTIRHPDVLKYIDSVETDSHVYIATERVRPLDGVLRDWQTGGGLGGSSKGKGKEEWIGWGVKGISTALAFLNAPPLSLHHSLLIPSSIFITPAMEWRLGGFDLITAKDDSAGVLWSLGGIAPGGVGERCAPEVQKGGWVALRGSDPALADTYLLAVLLFTLYNPNAPLPNLSAQPTPSSSGALPKILFPIWKRMLNPNPRTRLPTTSFVSEVANTGFWANNPLAILVEGLDGFELRSDGEKLALLRTIKDAASAGTVPPPFMTHRVLPSLLHSLSLPSAPSSAMLPLVLELGKHVPPSDYTKVVLDPVVKLYTSPDRGTRMALLDGLGEYADKMDAKTVQDRVWPHLITGFADTVPLIREATVKAIFPLASKLSDRLLNNDLLRLLAKMQTDIEPSIRTNTCILIGRLAPILGQNTKKKVLVPAFARSLKDPFVHARVAGLMAMMATVEIFDRDDLAGKVVPNMAFALVDKEKLVRDQAFKAMNMFVKRLESMVAEMPETVLEERTFGPVTTTSAPNGTNQAGLVNTATGAAGALAGWAISSLSKQLAVSEIHSTMSATSSLAPPNGSSSYSTPATSPRPSSDVSSVFGQANVSSSASLGPSAFGQTSGSSRLKGVKPAANGARGGTPQRGTKSNPIADAVAGEWEDGDEVANAWGTDDLIDVNADADDWAAFESAPVPEVAAPPPQSYYLSPPSNPVSPPRARSAPLSPPKAAPRAAPPPVTDTWEEAPVKSAASMAGMSKEEKDKEMARRREERAARIKAMKEQKEKKGKS